MRPIGEKRRKMAADNMMMYNAYKECIADKREDALSLGAIRYDKPNIQAESASMVELSAERLEAITLDHRARVVRAVDRARFLLEDHIDTMMRKYTDEERAIVKSAMWLNGINHIVNTYESFNVRTMPISRRTFYNYQRWFRNKVADLLGI